jgi:hypothetical protein
MIVRLESSAEGLWRPAVLAGGRTRIEAIARCKGVGLAAGMVGEHLDEATTSRQGSIPE